MPAEGLWPWGEKAPRKGSSCGGRSPAGSSTSPLRSLPLGMGGCPAWPPWCSCCGPGGCMAGMAGCGYAPAGCGSAGAPLPACGCCACGGEDDDAEDDDCQGVPFAWGGARGGCCCNCEAAGAEGAALEPVCGETNAAGAGAAGRPLPVAAGDATSTLGTAADARAHGSAGAATERTGAVAETAAPENGCWSCKVQESEAGSPSQHPLVQAAAIPCRVAVAFKSPPQCPGTELGARFSEPPLALLSGINLTVGLGSAGGQPPACCCC